MNKPIYFFYESSCQLCDELMDILNGYVQEKGIEIETIDVDTKDGESLFMEHEQGNCGGVPFLYNPNNQKTICGLVKKTDIDDFLK